MRERGLFSRLYEQRAADARYLSRSAFDRKWGRFCVVYDDPEALRNLLVSRFQIQGAQEDARVVRSQQKIEKLLSGG